MKKIIIPAAVLLAAACVQPFIKDKAPVKQPVITMQYNAPVKQENTRHYSEIFSALNVPDEMKQHFRLNANASQVVVGESGTMVLVPDNAFTDANGNTVNGKVKMEMVEGIKNADIIKMNLGTMSDQGPLQTGGMVYLNAFSENGDTLKLAKGKQLEVEIPTDQKKRGMKLWTGITNDDGSVSWTDPQPLKEELHSLPVSAIDESAEKKHEAAKEQTADGTNRIAWLRGDTAFYFNEQGWIIASGTSLSDTSQVLTSTANGNIQSINLADEKFANTNIATVEFRSRLPFIRQSCDTRVMQCYVENPTRELWKSDAAAADLLEKSGCPLAAVFRNLAELKQSKANVSDPKTVAALNEARERAVKNYSDNVRESQKMMNGYSFGMKKLGWANVDCLALNGGGTPMFLNVHVDNESPGERTETMLLVPSKNLFINGYKRPNGDYAFTHGEFEQHALYPKGTAAYVLSKTGKGDKFRFDLKKIIFGENEVENVSLHAGTEDELAKAMGNEAPKPDEPEKEIDDWYTKLLRSGKGCVCGGMAFDK